MYTTKDRIDSPTHYQKMQKNPDTDINISGKIIIVSWNSFQK